jgi:hypothetical protein
MRLKRKQAGRRGRILYSTLHIVGEGLREVGWSAGPFPGGIGDWRLETDKQFYLEGQEAGGKWAGLLGWFNRRVMRLNRQGYLADGIRGWREMGWTARVVLPKGHETEQAGLPGWWDKRLEGNGLDCYRVVLPKGHETEKAGYLADGIPGWREMGWTARVVLPKGHETEKAGYLADGIRGWREVGWTASVILPKGHETEKAGYLADGIPGWREMGWTARVVLPKADHETEQADYLADGVGGWWKWAGLLGGYYRRVMRLNGQVTWRMG